VKIAANNAQIKLVAAAGPTHVVSRHSGCVRGAFESGPYATWSPDGKQLAWVGGSAICVAEPDGTHVHPLPHTSGLVDSPFALAWVRPGLLLYGDDYVISRVPLAGKAKSLGVEAPGFSVAGDGSRFSTPTQSDCPTCTGQAHVWTMTGRPVGTIGSSKVFYDTTSLSPDGKSVAFAQDGGIWTARADGSHARRIAASGTAPLWSPSGTEIAYVRTAPGQVGDLWVVDTKSGVSRLVARSFSDNGGWSPNGRLIASLNIGGLAVVDVATGKVRRLPFVGYPSAWSPDSKELLVSGRSTTTRCSSLWREPVDGSKPRLVSSCY
jgi:hypothetical protein